MKNDCSALKYLTLSPFFLSDWAGKILKTQATLSNSSTGTSVA